MKGIVDKILGRYRQKDINTATVAPDLVDIISSDDSVGITQEEGVYDLKVPLTAITCVDESIELTLEGTSLDIKVKAKKLVFAAFLTQAGAEAPSAVVLEDTLTPVLSRHAAGEYDITKAGAFTLLKTGVIDDLYYDQSGNKYTINRISDDVLRLRTYAAINTAALADGVLNSRYVNIEAYI